MTELALTVFLALLFVGWRLFARLEEMEARISDLTKQLRQLQTGQRSQPGPEPVQKPAEPMEAPKPSAPVETAKAAPTTTPPVATPTPPPLPATAAAFQTTPPPEVPQPAPRKEPEPAPSWDQSSLRQSQEAVPEKEKSVLPGLTLEAFMGVKLFAWLGGLALFLGVVFFIRYSFEHNLVTPQMRVAIGALTGLGLVIGGLFMPRPKFTVTAQTLCATGIVILYGVTYGAHALYGFMGLGPAFAIMAVITGAAFLLAVRLEAQVVAILGLLGGFLTPILLSTGQDNPVGLFTYLAVLDAGLIAVALRQRWRHLVTLAAVATALMQLLWLGTYFAPSKIGVGTVVFLGFEALFLLPFWLCNRDDQGDSWTVAASGISAGMALAFAGYLLSYPLFGEQPFICLSILLAADAGLVVWPLRRNALQGGPLFGGGAAFLILNIWNFRYLNDDLLNWALGYFLVFAAFHTALPILLRRLRPAGTTTVPKWVQIFPALGLLLMLWPALHIGASTALWIAVLVADLAAILLAAVTASLVGVAAALLLTLIATGMWLVQAPVENPPLSGLLTVIAGFAALFCGASVFMQKRFRTKTSATQADSLEQQSLDHMPAISAAVPFVLLIGAVLRLHPANPSAIFGVGMLLVVIILSLAGYVGQTAALPPVALVCAALLEYCWSTEMAETGAVPMGWMPLAWYLGFTAVVFGFPLLFQSRKSTQLAPWVAAALAPVFHYPLILDLVSHTWPQFWNTTGGLLPAALALPPLAAAALLRRRLPLENPMRLAVLAWFCGVALLFITLIFPTQFKHEWLTLSWALEGVALLWLFHRLPHWGLRLVGFGLLCAAFARLAMNPAVLEYHAHSATPIWNWYLYTYGITAGCLYVAGNLTAPPRDRLAEVSLPAVFYSLGTILLFLLLNIEIADYFTTTPTLTFDFEGDLARDMTYSIAWSLFALGLLLVGMHRQVGPVRYAGIGLLVVTLVKLFLHDLANLDQLYRIGAFIMVAVVLIGASYLYQRFLAVEEKAPPGKQP